MLAIIAALFFGFAWLLHGTGAHITVWFSVDGMTLLGLASLALSLVWHPVIPVVRRQSPPPQ